MTDDEQYEFLLRGLVGERLELYRNNVYFNDAVKRLAHSLPALVEALAAKAEMGEREQWTRVRAMQDAGTAVSLESHVPIGSP